MSDLTPTLKADRLSVPAHFALAPRTPAAAGKLLRSSRLRAALRNMRQPVLLTDSRASSAAEAYSSLLQPSDFIAPPPVADLVSMLRLYSTGPGELTPNEKLVLQAPDDDDGFAAAVSKAQRKDDRATAVWSLTLSHCLSLSLTPLPQSLGS